MQQRSADHGHQRIEQVTDKRTSYWPMGYIPAVQHAYESTAILWSGAGSNHRPSAFQ
jgi:hypothetical protein